MGKFRHCPSWTTQSHRHHAMKDHIPRSDEDIRRIRENLEVRKPDTDTKPQQIDGQKSQVKMTIPALLGIIGFVIGMTLTFANWMANISGKLDAIQIQIGYVKESSWGLNDQRAYSANLQIANPALKVPVVEKVDGK